MKHDDIFVVDDFEEAEQFRYEHNDEPVEVGTAVAYDRPACPVKRLRSERTVNLAGRWRRKTCQ